MTKEFTPSKVTEFSNGKGFNEDRTSPQRKIAATSPPPPSCLIIQWGAAIIAHYVNDFDKFGNPVYEAETE